MRIIGGIFLVLLLSSIPGFAQQSAALTWTDPQTTVTWNVYRASGDCDTAQLTFTKLNPAPLTARNYLDPQLPIGTWCYHVTAQAGNLESQPSNRAEAIAVAVPNPPSGLSIVLQVAVTVKPNGDVVARLTVEK